MATSPPFGLRPHYYRVDGGGHASSLRTLFERDPQLSRALDRRGVAGFLDRSPDGERTCFQAIRKLRAGCALRKAIDGYEIETLDPIPPSAAPLRDALSDVLLEIVSDGRPTAVALSGGLDSALLLALLERVAPGRVEVCTLATGLPDYCELERTLETVRALGARDVAVRVLEFSEDNFVEALPETIAAVEAPLYNLHPVSKLLLARSLGSSGIEVVITGDGADHVFAGVSGEDYLPLVGAIFRHVGVELRAPYLDERVIGCARAAGVDREKSALRGASRGLVPSELLRAPKVSRLAPPMDLSRFFQSARIAELAATLGIAPRLDSDRDRVLWATLSVLVSIVADVSVTSPAPDRVTPERTPCAE